MRGRVLRGPLFRPYLHRRTIRPCTSNLHGQILHRRRSEDARTPSPATHSAALEGCPQQIATSDGRSEVYKQCIALIQGPNRIDLEKLRKIKVSLPEARRLLRRMTTMNTISGFFNVWQILGYPYDRKLAQIALEKILEAGRPWNAVKIALKMAEVDKSKLQESTLAALTLRVLFTTGHEKEGFQLVTYLKKTSGLKYGEVYEELMFYYTRNKKIDEATALFEQVNANLDIKVTDRFYIAFLTMISNQREKVFTSKFMKNALIRMRFRGLKPHITGLVCVMKLWINLGSIHEALKYCECFEILQHPTAFSHLFAGLRAHTKKRPFTIFEKVRIRRNLFKFWLAIKQLGGRDNVPSEVYECMNDWVYLIFHLGEKEMAKKAFSWASQNVSDVEALRLILSHGFPIPSHSKTRAALNRYLEECRISTLASIYIHVKETSMKGNASSTRYTKSNTTEESLDLREADVDQNSNSIDWKNKKPWTENVLTTAKVTKAVFESLPVDSPLRDSFCMQLLQMSIYAILDEKKQILNNRLVLDYNASKKNPNMPKPYDGEIESTPVDFIGSMMYLMYMAGFSEAVRAIHFHTRRLGLAHHKEIALPGALCVEEGEQSFVKGYETWLMEVYNAGISNSEKKLCQYAFAWSRASYNLFDEELAFRAMMNNKDLKHREFVAVVRGLPDRVSAWDIFWKFQGGLEEVKMVYGCKERMAVLTFKTSEDVDKAVSMSGSTISCIRTNKKPKITVETPKPWHNKIKGRAIAYQKPSTYTTRRYPYPKFIETLDGLFRTIDRKQESLDSDDLEMLQNKRLQHRSDVGLQMLKYSYEGGKNWWRADLTSGMMKIAGGLVNKWKYIGIKSRLIALLLLNRYASRLFEKPVTLHTQVLRNNLRSCIGKVQQRNRDHPVSDETEAEVLNTVLWRLMIFQTGAQQRICRALDIKAALQNPPWEHQESSRRESNLIWLEKLSKFDNDVGKELNHWGEIKSPVLPVIVNLIQSAKLKNNLIGARSVSA
uniref:RRM domain-containing protein n=1 Tax=Amorphochlora amoebiformis TaxID=1561963 RepID=A0A7S0DQ10_9EUKA|mmetsp:Transcript_4670/g.7126  ORF Transcript_4670/g.7126 Transcript_4670/m.7126 type:complete len:1004 (+) Transcript_4670:53-3064(+)